MSAVSVGVRLPVDSLATFRRLDENVRLAVARTIVDELIAPRIVLNVDVSDFTLREQTRSRLQDVLDVPHVFFLLTNPG